MINLSFSLSSGLTMTQEYDRAIRQVTDQDAKVVAKLLRNRPTLPAIRTVPTLDQILAEEPTRMVFDRLDFDWNAWQATFPRTSLPQDFVAPVVHFDEATLLRVASFTALCGQVEYKVFLRVSRSSDRRVLKVSDYDVVPLQEVTGKRVRHTHDRKRLASMLAYERRSSPDEVLQMLKGDLHSHVEMATRPSDLDLRETFSFASGLGSRHQQTPTVWWLAIIVNRLGDFYIYYVDLEQGVMVEDLNWTLSNTLSSEEARIAMAKDTLPNALRELRQNVSSGMPQATRPVSKTSPQPVDGEQSTPAEWADTSDVVIPAVSPQQIAQAPNVAVTEGLEPPDTAPSHENVPSVEPSPEQAKKRPRRGWRGLLYASVAFQLLVLVITASLSLWDRNPTSDSVVSDSVVVDRGAPAVAATEPTPPSQGEEAAPIVSSPVKK